MCDPASLAMAVGGTLLQKVGQSKARKAGRNAQVRETTRQDKLSEEARAALNVSVDDFGSTETDMQATASRIGEQIQAAMLKAKDGIVIPPSGSLKNAPAIVKSDAKGRAADSAVDARQNNKRLANVTSFDHTIFDKNAGLVQNRNIIDMITGLQGGSLNVLPLELDAAKQKGSGLRMAGDLMKLAGSAYGMKTMNAPLSAASATAPISLYSGNINGPAP